MSSSNHFPFCAFVTITYWTSTKVLPNLVAPLDSAVPSPDFDQSMFFELSLLIPLVFFLIRSVSAESSLYCISRTLFRCSFFWPWLNQYMIHLLYSISTAQFPAMICSVFIRRLSKSCCWLNLAVSYFDFVRIIFVYFVCICYLCTTQLSFVIFSQISTSCSHPFYRKHEFCLASFWFYY